MNCRFHNPAAVSADSRGLLCMLSLLSSVTSVFITHINSFAVFTTTPSFISLFILQ